MSDIDSPEISISNEQKVQKGSRLRNVFKRLIPGRNKSMKETSASLDHTKFEDKDNPNPVRNSSLVQERLKKDYGEILEELPITKRLAQLEPKFTNVAVRHELDSALKQNEKEWTEAQRQAEQERADLEKKRAELERIRAEQAEKDSITDPLTGLYNRRYINQKLPHIIEHSRREGDAVSAIRLDLDNFKEVNDGFGHAAGDAVIQSAAFFIRQVLHREHDIPFRDGGDEFGIILPDTSEEGALVVAATLRKLIEDRMLDANADRLPGRENAITSSIGVATMDRDNTVDASKLMEQADIALYQSKHPDDKRRPSKNTVTVFQQGMTQPKREEKAA